MQYAGLTKDVVIIGGADHLQIWDRATWARDEVFPPPCRHHRPDERRRSVPLRPRSS